jgi:peptidoglycan hydrolase CwlO-like protein
MLQMMQKKIESEQKVEQELFEKFMCYCKTGVGSLVQSIKDAEGKIGQLESSIEETDSVTKQLTSDIKKAKADRTEATETMGKAKAIRAKEAGAFAKAAADAKTNIASMGKAITALEKGAGSAFLQTSAAGVLKKLSITMDIEEADRDALASFLSTNNQADSEDGENAAGSGEILGILKQMQETMTHALGEATESEASAKKDFEALTAAKERQVSTLAREIESKMVRSGEAGVELTNQKEDLRDTSKGLTSDKKFLIDVTKDCQTKEAQKEANDKMRADEMLALADTIKILNDDDALDLFKKTMPGSSSFLQMQVSSKQMKQKAIQALRHKNHGKRDFRLNLITLALRGKKANFDKVITIIDNMSALLKKEQGSDDTKKGYCTKNIASTEAEFGELQADIKDLDKAIAEHKESIKSMTAEIDALTTGITEMDKQVASATAQRKEEHAEYQEAMASDGAAKELLEMAKNRLSKFYSPKSASAAFVQEEESTPTAAPVNDITAAFSDYESDAQEEEQNVGFLQVRAASRHRKKAAPPPPPETSGAYKKSGSESNGIMAMLGVMQSDLQKGMTENEVNEKEAQKEYEQFIKDSADKRAGDSKSISDKEGTKVELEANTLKMQQGRKGKMQESMAKMEAIEGLHKECDWLIQNYDTRKKARSSELDNLTNAKAVLSGADYSF